MTLRDLDIDIELDIDSGELAQVSAQIDAFKAQLVSLDTNINIDIDADLAQAQQQVQMLEQQLDQLSHTPVNVDVDVDTAQAALQIHALNQQLNTLEHDIDIDLDTAAAHSQLGLLQAHMASLQASNNIGNVGNVGGVGGAASSVASAGGLFSPATLASLGVKTAGLIVALPLLASVAGVATGAIGTLGVAVGVLGGGLLGLAGAAAVGIGGIGGFALSAVPMITKLYDENAKLNQQQRDLKGGIEMMTGVWDELQKSVEYTTFQAVESGLHAINAGIRVMEPILNSANEAVGGLFVNLENSIRGERMTGFFQYLERAIGPLTQNIGNGLGYALQGVANGLVALEPLTDWVGQGFENMMERFSNWTFELQGSEKLTAFIDYVKAELPTIGSILGGATDGVVNFFAAFDTTASDGLGWMAEKMQEFATWSSELDSNTGFQDMLARISEDGPKVAEAIGNIVEHITKLTGAISDSGALDTLNALFNMDFLKYDEIGELFSLKNFIDPMGGLFGAVKSVDWGNLFGGIGGLFGGDKPKLDVEVGADTSNFEAELMAMSKTDLIEYAVTADVDMAEAEIGRLTKHEIVDLLVDADTGPLQSSLDAETSKQRQVTMQAQVENVDTTRLGPVKLQADLAFGQQSFMPKFTWPPLPQFTWPALPKFDWPPLPKWNWPAMPTFRWPAYPVFRWPAMPTVRVSVSGGGTAVQGSHATGLGRVPHDGYIAETHKDEAILTANQADVLRDMGMLSGDGAAPSLNLPTMPSGSIGGGGGTTQVDVGGVTVYVQGGNTNAETGASVRAVIEEVFSDLAAVFPRRREV